MFLQSCFSYAYDVEENRIVSVNANMMNHVDLVSGTEIGKELTTLILSFDCLFKDGHLISKAFPKILKSLPLVFHPDVVIITNK